MQCFDVVSFNNAIKDEETNFPFESLTSIPVIREGRVYRRGIDRNKMNKTLRSFLAV